MTSSSGRVHLSVSAARDLAEAVLRANGYTEGEARIIGEHVLDAALCGYEYSGLPKLLDAIEHARAKLPRSAMRIVRETPVSALFDAGNNNGMLAMREATQAAIEKAQTSGIALIGVTNSWMSARSAYFVEMIARAGLVGIMLVGAIPLVAPLGGASPVLGTNPIAFGLPGPGNPFVLDMGMSIMTWTDLSLHARLGKPIAPGVAIDAQGEPTQDPARARKGALLYFGGHKGFGLALAMQALAMLTVDPLWTKDKSFGYLIIAFKPDLLVPLEDFKRELETLIERVKNAPRQAGVDEIRIPSERAFREREQRRKDGIEIDEPIYAALKRAAGLPSSP